jgi:hypothetical protein
VFQLQLPLAGGNSLNLAWFSCPKLGKNKAVKPRAKGKLPLHPAAHPAKQAFKYGYFKKIIYLSYIILKLCLKNLYSPLVLPLYWDLPKHNKMIFYHKVLHRAKKP